MDRTLEIIEMMDKIKKDINKAPMVEYIKIRDKAIKCAEGNNRLIEAINGIYRYIGISDQTI